MRHGDKHRKFSMPKSQRRALFSNLTGALLTHEQITITLTRAKELRTFADKMITYAKKGDLNSRRQAAKFIFDKETGKFMDLTTGETF
ncbi:MAG: 50S ribosomal protein L17, partial [Alphaproteobacteria bacterium]|nr:50S ribosomal protein L17 [Alphaproteobacteria bacterium]